MIEFIVFIVAVFLFMGLAHSIGYYYGVYECDQYHKNRSNPEYRHIRDYLNSFTEIEDE